MVVHAFHADFQEILVAILQVGTGEEPLGVHESFRIQEAGKTIKRTRGEEEAIVRSDAIPCKDIKPEALCHAALDAELAVEPFARRGNLFGWICIAVYERSLVSAVRVEAPFGSEIENGTVGHFHICLHIRRCCKGIVLSGDEHDVCPQFDVPVVSLYLIIRRYDNLRMVLEQARAGARGIDRQVVVEIFHLAAYAQTLFAVEAGVEVELCIDCMLGWTIQLFVESIFMREVDVIQIHQIENIRVLVSLYTRFDLDGLIHLVCFAIRL